MAQTTPSEHRAWARPSQDKVAPSPKPAPCPGRQLGHMPVATTATQQGLKGQATAWASGDVSRPDVGGERKAAVTHVEDPDEVHSGKSGDRIPDPRAHRSGPGNRGLPHLAAAEGCGRTLLRAAAPGRWPGPESGSGTPTGREMSTLGGVHGALGWGLGRGAAAPALQTARGRGGKHQALLNQRDVQRGPAQTYTTGPRGLGRKATWERPGAQERPRVRGDLRTDTAALRCPRLRGSHDAEPAAAGRGSGGSGRTVRNEDLGAEDQLPPKARTWGHRGPGSSWTLSTARQGQVVSGAGTL